MRILTITSGGQISNGALLAAIQSAHGLADRGHDVSFLSPANSFADKHVDRSKLQVINGNLNRWPLNELTRTRDWIEQNAIDIVHTHCSRANAFGVLLRRLYGIPVVATAHANKIQLHWCFNDHVVAVSDATRRFHIRRNLVLPWKISTLLNPIDTHRFQPTSESEKTAVRESLGLFPDSVLLSIVGNVIPRKGHIDAVRAVAKIASHVPTVRLAIIGRASEEDRKPLEQEAARLGVAENVLWLGHRDDAAALMAATDILLCPSLDEPFGLVAPEALACEVPVIATAVGGFLTTIQDGETGYLVRPRSPGEIADAALQLVRNPSLRRCFGRRGRSWVTEHLSPNAHFSTLEATLHTVINKSLHRRKAKSVLGFHAEKVA